MRIPLVMQADRAECGLACLAMVAGYYGHRASLHEYRSRFHVSQRGSSLKHIRDFAEVMGFKCRGVRLEIDELPQLRAPAILHWNLDHFVVLKSLDRKAARILDPAVGSRKIEMDEFGKAFTGIALELSPTPAFKPQKKAEVIAFSSFLSSLRGLGGTLGGIFAMTVALQAFALVMPLNTQFTIDQGIRQGDMHIIAALAVGFGLIGLTSAAVGYFRSLLIQFAGNTSAFRIVSGLAHHMIRLPDSWFEGRHTGDILSRFGSTQPIRQFLMTGAFAMLVDALMAIGSLCVLLAYSWELTLAVSGFLVVFASLNLGTYAPLRNLTHESIAAKAQENSSFIENIERHRAIKLLVAETHREDAWGARYVESINAGARLARFRIHLGFAGSSIGSIQSVLMLLLGASKVVSGEFTLGMLMAFTTYSGMFSGRVHALINAALNLRILLLHRERIADIALEERETSPEQEGIQHELRGAVDIRSVSFGYDEGYEVIKKLDLDTKPGEFVAIKGESGAGKSTLVKLLCKLLRPSEGQILIDGLELERLDTAHYRGQIGVVMQDDDLFSGSVFENIAVGESGADMERVEEVSRQACIHDDIARMPMQYLTLIGHMGSTLSGGQRQRIMIARAIYRNPKLLILDEGTAHLNETLQERVLDNLLRSGATIIAVTHHARVLERADRIIRLV
ncbi:MAG: peptidase domain-containing ABC transporter [Gammaproteobacteria bacterium]|nr:peptidase domain-containing ABC transporter [Gammaproteobacteria bacterium]MCY4165402.1 peptidase domain-containing ABC transporter [Gammaproteobacteria bacterium]MCY4254735.1 peptidase domain-containing ABC transporter [Gammaproteobacteria bacterium]MCY4339891.1 peptidase domain-containing ABC transporter [Gammaproteobacteria bacterium]